MSATAETIHSQENVAKLAKMLLKTQYSGFPVVKYDEETKTEVLYGLITRSVCCSVYHLNAAVYRMCAVAPSGECLRGKSPPDRMLATWQ